MGSTRSRQIVLEAAPGVQPNPSETVQGAAPGAAPDELCPPALGEPCEPGTDTYDWEQVLTF